MMAAAQASKQNRPMKIRAQKLRIDGRLYAPKNKSGYKVYKSSEPGLRKVFVPGDARTHGKRLPKTAQVYYDGEWRDATRSFRMKDGIGRVPVYQFHVSE